MKNIFKYIVILAAGALAFQACDKWTDAEPVEVVYKDLKSKNPQLWAKYLESIRNYHNTDHQVLIAKFDNKATTPEGRGEHINCLPDSVDYVILNNPLSVSETISKEVAEIREQKAVRTLVPVSLDEIKSSYDKEYAEEIDAYWQREDATLDDCPLDTPERFEAYVSQHLPAKLEAASTGNFDGILVIFNGVNPASYAESALEGVIQRQKSMFSLVDSWISSHSNALVFFEGTPGYVACETSVISTAKYIIIPALAEVNEQALSYVVSQAVAAGSPADRIVIGVTTVDITDPTNTNGSFGSVSAIVGAAQWAVRSETGIVKKGVCVDHAQFDYYDITNVYSQINKAISIMNPSPVK